MRPYISDKPLRRLNVPDLSGGVNYRDGISQVMDNQLTDCKNVWFKNGVLQTRPGITCVKELPTFETDFLPYSNFGTDIKNNKKVYAKKENFRVIKGVTYQLVVFQYEDRLVFRYYSDIDSFIPVAEITDIPKDDFTCNIFQYNADIYCFCSGYYEGETTPFYIYKITEKDEGFNVERITQDKVYVPTLLINGGPDGGLSEVGPGVSLETMTSRGMSMLEGYNLLGNRYKAIYSTARNEDNPPDTIAPDTNNNYMSYSLPWKMNGGRLAADDFTGQTVEAEITDISGTVYKHKVVLNKNSSFYDAESDADLPGDGLRMYVSGRTFYFKKEKDDSEIARWSTDEFVINNMVVTAPCPNSKENYEKVLNMTQNEWFGGGSEGIYGGLHLFMGGNTKDEEKALVCWSDFNKPLYFSENCYAYAGDKAQKVTAFGKQNDNLVIFKERETYATQYSSSDSVTDAESVINQSVIDVTAAEVTFPMTQIHGYIGCDCPYSVQLCRNRLVWAHSDGKIYTLVSSSQWNERSIFETSNMIEPLLKKIGAEKLKTALSADWEGCYILSAEDKLILMDYNSYGYSHIYSYTKEDDAQMHIPYWIWDKPNHNEYTFYNSDNLDERRLEPKNKPISIEEIFILGDSIYFVCKFAAYIADKGGHYIYELLKIKGVNDVVPEVIISENGSGAHFKERETTVQEISAMAQTKLFDFGSPSMQKTVPKSEIAFGNNEGIPITVTTITDRGESSEEIILDYEETDKRNPQFFRSVVVRNAERLNNRIGYKFESQGNIFVAALTLHFKFIGDGK